MKRLVRFYPARWRRRYEDEFLAYLEDEGPLSAGQRLDLLRGLVEAHLLALREPWRNASAPRGDTVRSLAGAGMGVLFTTSGKGGILMRRQPLAVLFLLTGLLLGLIVPYARQTVTAAFSSPPPGYTALIYQNADLAPMGHEGMTSIDIVNTGRPMPRLVLALPAKSGVQFEARRDHKVILVHRFLHLGHGMVGYSLCPLAPGHTATLYLWWPRTPVAQHLDQPPDYAFYGRIPRLVNVGRTLRPIWGDPQAAIFDIRSSPK